MIRIALNLNIPATEQAMGKSPMHVDKVRMYIPPGFSTVPIIFNDSQRRALPPAHKHFFGMEHAPLETQNMLQRMFLEVFARILLWHPREQVLELLSVRWLRKRPAPNDGKDFSGSVIMPRPAPRTREQLNTTRHAITMKQCPGGLADVIVTILCINPHSESSQIAASSRACLLHQAVPVSYTHLTLPTICSV